MIFRRAMTKLSFVRQTEMFTYKVIASYPQIDKHRDWAPEFYHFSGFL